MKYQAHKFIWSISTLPEVYTFKSCSNPQVYGTKPQCSLVNSFNTLNGNSWTKHDLFWECLTTTKDNDVKFKTLSAQYETYIYKINPNRLRWCLFFWLFTENHLVLEFRLFVFFTFSWLFINFLLNRKSQNMWLFLNKKNNTIVFFTF